MAEYADMNQLQDEVARLAPSELLMPDHLQDEFLLLNGDSIFDFNYLDLSNCARAGEPANWLARVALLPVEHATRYGFVELDGPRIRAFREKPENPESGRAGWPRSSGGSCAAADPLNRPPRPPQACPTT